MSLNYCWMIFKEVKLKGWLFRGGGAGATMDPEAFLDMANQVLIIIIIISEIIFFIKIISSIKIITITIMEIDIDATIYFYVGPSPYRGVEAEPALIIIMLIITTIITIFIIITVIIITR